MIISDVVGVDASDIPNIGRVETLYQALYGLPQNGKIGELLIFIDNSLGMGPIDIEAVVDFYFAILLDSSHLRQYSTDNAFYHIMTGGFNCQ